MIHYFERDVGQGGPDIGEVAFQQEGLAGGAIGAVVGGDVDQINPSGADCFGGCGGRIAGRGVGVAFGDAPGGLGASLFGGDRGAGVDLGRLNAAIGGSRAGGGMNGFDGHRDDVDAGCQTVQRLTQPVAEVPGDNALVSAQHIRQRPCGEETCQQPPGQGVDQCVRVGGAVERGAGIGVAQSDAVQHAHAGTDGLQALAVRFAAGDDIGQVGWLLLVPQAIGGIGCVALGGRVVVSQWRRWVADQGCVDDAKLEMADDAERPWQHEMQAWPQYCRGAAEAFV